MNKPGFNWKIFTVCFIGTVIFFYIIGEYFGKIPEEIFLWIAIPLVVVALILKVWNMILDRKLKLLKEETARLQNRWDNLKKRGIQSEEDRRTDSKDA